jgi:hypothetical protein
VGVVTGRLVAWISFVVFFGGVAFAGRFASDPAPNQLYEASFFVGSLVTFAIILGVASLIAIGLPKRETFALRRPRSWWTAVGIGALVIVGVFVLGAALSPFLDPGKEQGLLPDKWPPPSWFVYGLSAAAVVVLAPVAEELMFRGLGYALLERFGATLAIVGTAAAWAFVHGLVEGFPLIFSLGIGLGFLRRVTGSILPGMLVHASFNAIALGAAAYEASH